MESRQSELAASRVCNIHLIQPETLTTIIQSVNLVLSRRRERLNRISAAEEQI